VQQQNVLDEATLVGTDRLSATFYYLFNLLRVNITYYSVKLQY